MKILIVNRFFGGAQIPTGRMAEDVARVLAESGHEVTALASTGTYAGAEKRAGYESRVTSGEWDEAVPSAESDTEPKHRTTTSPKHRSTLRVETVRVPTWMPRALAWLWFTWQARKRIPRMDWDVCVLMTDPPLLPLLVPRAKAAGVCQEAVSPSLGSVGQCSPSAAPHAVSQTRLGKAVEDERLKNRTLKNGNTERPPHWATRRVAVWLMDLYPEALAASGRLSEGNPIYRWYFNKRQRALGASDLLLFLGHAQEERAQMDNGTTGQPEGGGLRPETGDRLLGNQLTQDHGTAVSTETLKHRNTEPPGALGPRTVVVPPWDDRGNIALATEESLRNLALYAGNLGEAHCFEEILAAAPHLPGGWKVRFAVRGVKFAELKEKASQSGHGLTRIKGRISPGGCADRTGQECSVLGDPSTRNAPPEGKAIEQESHSRPQGDRQLEELSEAVKLKKIEEDLFCAGDTVAKSSIQAEGKQQGAFVEVTGYAGEEETPGLLASARVHLITMSPGWEGIVVPSKLYGCVRTGRPVLFIGPENADTAREILANDWGSVLSPGASGEEVAGAILELAARPTKTPAEQCGAQQVAELLREQATDRHG